MSAQLHGTKWMLTYTGKMVYPHQLRVEDICIEDIAHALAYQCRYNGHCNRFYSVAEHCVLVSREVEKFTMNKGAALAGLLHDASETWLGDTISPNKTDEHRALEEIIDRKVFDFLGIPWDALSHVKIIDHEIIYDEMAALFDNQEIQPRLGVQITCLDPESAEHAFLNRWRALNGWW